MYTDGACRGNPGLSGIGVVVMDDKEVVDSLHHFVGLLTNNQAEYLALIHGLLWFQQNLDKYPGFEGLDIFSDSRLMVLQILEKHKVKNVSLAPLHRIVRETLDALPSWSITHVPRKENKLADKLAAQSLEPYLN